MSKAEDLAGLLDANGDVLANNLDNVSVAFADLTGKPTTISGYGITDAFDGTYSSLTGAPTAVSSFTNDSGYATTTYVDNEVAGIVASAPAALDTLNELAAALGDDANFSTTVTTSLGEKLVKASNLSDLTNAATARTNLGLGTAATTASTDYATAAQGSTADSAMQDLVDDTTPQLGGDLDTNGNAILFGSSKWSVELDTGDNDLLFKYNGTTVFKIASNGAITSANEVTAFGSP